MTESRRGRRRVRRAILSTLQIVVAAVALLFLVTTIDLVSGLSLLLTLDVAVLLAVGGLTVVEFGTRFSMWYVLLTARSEVDVETAARVDLVIKFVNHLLPSKAAGHSVTPIVLRYYTSFSWRECLALAAASTGLYATLYATGAVVALLVLAPVLPWELVVVLAMASGVYAVVAVSVVLAGRNVAGVVSVLTRFGHVLENHVPGGERVVDAMPSPAPSDGTAQSLFDRATGHLAVVGPYTLGWAGTLVVVPGLRALLLLWAFEAPISPWWVVPLALLLGYSVTILPISPGGIGVTELSATLVFVALGVPEHVAVVVILLDRTLGVYLPALLGWLPAARIDVVGLFERATG